MSNSISVAICSRERVHPTMIRCSFGSANANYDLYAPQQPTLAARSIVIG
jgi:hypothetical protein